ncbi:unnamed protein product [Didymodactylos carnosus]|uniref:FLYWCH-type domain-containing protein n=1 Tax=Didymodactylos carnosus TaxID=1234261 RepID=A0A814ZBY3_9BILA|nr:unnamed protein product [Didymodactylos carnosus]CAF1581752.1 unnamed protein product [Didymodactylos carnosus]CAF4003979.1 unnamed protein product [Didymodactylos carnosus]CAF4381446.1 unnamed protein product [Didymodactylos carnosus]
MYKIIKVKLRARCVKSNCSGRVTFDGTQYIKLTDHSHVSNPDEIIDAEFKSKISERAITSHDPPRRIIKDDIPLPRPTSFEDISIPHRGVNLVLFFIYNNG